MSDSKNLSSETQSILYDVLIKHELILNRTLGTRKTNPVDIEPHPGAIPYHSNQYLVPQSHEDVLKKLV